MESGESVHKAKEMIKPLFNALLSSSLLLGTVCTAAEAPSLKEDVHILGKIQEEIRKTNAEEWQICLTMNSLKYLALKWQNGGSN